MATHTAPIAFQPAYLKLLRNNTLAERAEQAYRHMADRDLCARYCHVNRFETLDGAVCRTGARAVVNSFGAHHGEDDVHGSTSVAIAQGCAFVSD